MKMTNRLIILAATLLAFASCTKEEVSGGLAPDAASEGGVREIALSFSGATKANLDWPTPFFEAGDKILLSNNSATETCIVKTRNGKAFIITQLTGTLTAVYPAAAATLSGNQITGFKVPSNQDGKFSDAVISMAENISGNHATFDCKVPILKFYADASIKVNRIDVQGTGVASGVNTIRFFVNQYTIRNNPDPRICYVAVMPGINANTLTFTSQTNSQGTVEKACTTNAVLQAGHTYNAFIPYYIDLGAAGKWGYCNVGAFLPEEIGWYFSWGNTTGYPVFDDDHTENYDSTPGGGLSVNEIPVNATYDAAYKHWGEDWRIPTYEEFVALVNGTICSWTAVNGKNGRKFINNTDTDKYVFFPAIFAERVRGMYWSSTRNGNPYNLDFDSTSVGIAGKSSMRRRGRTIRPVTDITLEGELDDYPSKEIVGVPQVASLPGKFTVSPSGRQVQFSPANLRYILATSQWDFFGHQYECNRTTADYYNTSISLFTWGKGRWSVRKDSGSGYEEYYTGKEDIQGTAHDWGTGKWRTLTYAEWKYLLYERHITDNVGFAKARLNGVEGIVIFPDGYSGATSGDGLRAYNTYFPNSDIPSATWTAMESAGVVFLPADYHRYGSSIYRSNPELHYWTATHVAGSSAISYCIVITRDDYSNADKTQSRSYGLSVRLVTDVIE